MRFAIIAVALGLGCSAEAQESADDELNRYYAAAAKRLGDDEKVEILEQLRSAQQAWTRFRDAECEAVAVSWRPGSLASTMQAVCINRLTRARTRTIWASWLTYADSTPPILPRPADE